VEDAGRGFDINPAKPSDAIVPSGSVAGTDNGLSGGGGGGSGLGLFSVRERVALLGGKMEVSTCPGRGTRISLQLPLSTVPVPARATMPVVNAPADSALFRPPAAPPRPAAATPATGAARIRHRSKRAPSAIRIVVADDHQIVRDGLVGVLRAQRGMEVVGTAADGHAALIMARRLHPDVVVMDVTMPILNGIEATRALSAELPQIRVIGLSMHRAEDMAKAMREAGAAAYVCKSGPMHELVKVIRRTARR
jgi:CheY-like chemotaxis protein